MRVRRGASSFLLLAASVGWLTAAALQSPTPALAKVNFSRDVLPILSDKCFKCHGPDAGSRMADLRLDDPKVALANRGGRWAIVPGKPKSSLVVQRINNKDMPMPPPSSGKTLSPREKQILEQWIAEGANYSRLWSFEPLPAKVAVPKVQSIWPRDDLDRFVLARLLKENLKPSPPASRERWLRRVTYDLNGLPPTEAETDAFLGDKAPNAYEKVVDRLLASPHFGERIAVEWLDAARYSDSYGYQSDLLSPTWPYRDWVVKSFNGNLPYDQFLTDQLAGDLLPNATRDQRLATAFNRLHRQSNEGGSIPLEFKTSYAEDRVETFGTAVLGLTFGCARCHDHKFDPITQREYFQLFAYFNSIDEYGLLLSTEIVPTPSLLLPTPEQEAQLKELRRQNEAARQGIAKANQEAEGRYEQWLKSPPATPEIPGILAHITLDTENTGRFANDPPGQIVAEKLDRVDSVPGLKGNAVVLNGDNGLSIKGLPARERWEPFTWSFWVQDPRVDKPVVLLHRTGGTDVGFCGFDLILEDGYLTARVMRHWPGNAVAVRTKTQVPKGTWANIGWSWDGSGRAEGLKLYLDGKPAPITVLADKIWKSINAYGDLGSSQGNWAFGQRFRDIGFKGGKLDEIVFANRALCPLEVAQLYDGVSLINALKSPSDVLREYYLAAIDPQTQKAQADEREAQAHLATAEEGVYEVSVMEESPTEIPAYVLARGQYDAPRTDANKVVRDTPKALPRLTPKGKNDRLALAKWVTRPDHPLTARVAVNRFWQIFFGVGLVETSENFGVQGTPPTHPELLDYLARRFIDSGWDVKKLLKEIVLSATYRQDSARPNKADPRNRLFSRGPSGRLPAEMVRDTALDASGLLNDKLGGPPVNPYQPAGIWQENNTMSPPFVQSKGADLYRRSLYSTWKRTTPVPSMMLFDANSREACTMRRPATNTPLQALVLLNDIQFVEASRALAETVLKMSLTDSQRIAEAFRRLAARRPDQRETEVLLQALREQREEFKKDPASAAKLIAVGDSKASKDLKPEELAAMTVTVQTILNSDAVIWKR